MGFGGFKFWTLLLVNAKMMDAEAGCARRLIANKQNLLRKFSTSALTGYAADAQNELGGVDIGAPAGGGPHVPGARQSCPFRLMAWRPAVCGACGGPKEL